MEEWGAERSSGLRRFYDGLALLLLAWPATGGMWLLGSTRTWGYAPGLALSFLGSALTFARPLVFRDVPRRPVPPGFWAFAALAAYVVLGVAWAPVPDAARWEALRWTCVLAAAWSWTQMAGQDRRWKWLLFILLLSVAFESLYALVQEVNGSTRVLWELRPEQYGRRASGTYLCPNHFANVLAMLFPLAILAVFSAEIGFPLRLMAFYFLAVSAPVLVWTQSRSAWAGLLGGCCAAGLLLAWRRGRAWFLAALVALPLLAAASGWAAWKALPRVHVRIQEVLEKREGAAGIRIPMWKDMPPMIRARPIAGHGGGSFMWAYPPYQNHVRQHLTWDFLHNEYLQMQVEYGAIGLGLLLAGLLWAGIGAAGAIVRARSNLAAQLLAGAAGGAAASLIHATFDFNFHIFPNPHVLAWIGAVAWSVWAVREGAGGKPGSWRWPGRVGLGLGALGCAAGAWLALAGGLSYAWNVKGELARAGMEWDEALAAYDRSIRWDAGNWQPHLGIGNLKAAQALWYRDPDPAAEREGKARLAAEAEASLRRARERNPLDMAVAVGLARVHNAAGDPEAALAEFRRAAEHQRKHVFYREQVGLQLVRMGREREALEVFRKNVADGVGGEVSELNVRRLERKFVKEAAAAAP